MVLERIHFLMQSLPAVASSDNSLPISALDEKTPLLTDVYEGDSEQLVAVLSRQAQVDNVLNEMRPLIHQEVATAVLLASETLTQALISKLESDLIKTLGDRLMKE